MYMLATAENWVLVIYKFYIQLMNYIDFHIFSICESHCTCIPLLCHPTYVIRPKKCKSRRNAILDSFEKLLSTLRIPPRSFIQRIIDARNNITSLVALFDKNARDFDKNHKNYLARRREKEASRQGAAHKSGKDSGRSAKCDITRGR